VRRLPLRIRLAHSGHVLSESFVSVALLAEMGAILDCGLSTEPVRHNMVEVDGRPNAKPPIGAPEISLAAPAAALSGKPPDLCGELAAAHACPPRKSIGQIASIISRDRWQVTAMLWSEMQSR